MKFRLATLLLWPPLLTAVAVGTFIVLDTYWPVLAPLVNELVLYFETPIMEGS